VHARAQARIFVHQPSARAAVRLLAEREQGEPQREQNARKRPGDDSNSRSSA
jgi:hypothetical protein